MRMCKCDSRCERAGSRMMRGSSCRASPALALWFHGYRYQPPRTPDRSIIVSNHVPLYAICGMRVLPARVCGGDEPGVINRIRPRPWPRPFQGVLHGWPPLSRLRLAAPSRLPCGGRAVDLISRLPIWASPCTHTDDRRFFVIRRAAFVSSP